MNWRARLAEQRSEDISKLAGGLADKTDKSVNDAQTRTDKTDKTSSVSFVSDLDGHVENIAPDPITFADTLKPLRAHLLALAVAKGMDAGQVHRLHDLDIAACIGLDARGMATYLSALADTAHRHAGRVPLDDTAAMRCERCGPVWIHPDIAAVLPVIGGWPRALGCPWCFVRKAGGYIPRPTIT